MIAISEMSHSGGRSVNRRNPAAVDPCAELAAASERFEADARRLALDIAPGVFDPWLDRVRSPRKAARGMADALLTA